MFCTVQVCDQSQSQESLSDWRGELLLALQDVLLKERGVLLAAFRMDLTSLGTRDVNGLLNCLERRIQEQVLKQNYFKEYFLNRKKKVGY